jgi:hypothetical protein
MAFNGLLPLTRGQWVWFWKGQKFNLSIFPKTNLRDRLDFGFQKRKGKSLTQLT